MARNSCLRRPVAAWDLAHRTTDTAADDFRSCYQSRTGPGPRFNCTAGATRAGAPGSGMIKSAYSSCVAALTEHQSPRSSNFRCCEIVTEVGDKLYSEL